jgi:hypothetical protein
MSFIKKHVHQFLDWHSSSSSPQQADDWKPSSAHDFFQRFNAFTNSTLPATQYLIASLDKTSSKTISKLMPMKAKDQTQTFTSKIKRTFQKHFIPLQILLITFIMTVQIQMKIS